MQALRRRSSGTGIVLKLVAGVLVSIPQEAFDKCKDVRGMLSYKVKVQEFSKGEAQEFDGFGLSSHSFQIHGVWRSSDACCRT